MDSPDPDATSRPRLAYLTGAYPAVSHTFILREVEGLRDLGLEVLPCSIRRTPPEQRPGPAEAAEAARTFHVLEAAKRPATLLAAQAAGLRNPGRYFRTLALALKTARPGLKGFLWQLFYFAEATVLARHLQDQGVDHLHNHFADSSANVAMLATALADIGFPTRCTVRPRSTIRWAGISREKTAQARFVFCISHFARSQAMLFSDPAHWPKLKIIHCGVTPERYGAQAAGHPRRPAPGLRRAPGADQGARVLMEAFAAAREKVPGLRLTLVGDGADRPISRRMAGPMARMSALPAYLDQDGRGRDAAPGRCAGAALFRRGRAGRADGGDGLGQAGDRHPGGRGFGTGRGRGVGTCRAAGRSREPGGGHHRPGRSGGAGAHGAGGPTRVVAEFDIRHRSRAHRCASDRTGRRWHPARSAPPAPSRAEEAAQCAE
jgi:hypothetical protein